MNTRLALYDAIGRYGLDAARGDALFRLAGFDTEPPSLPRRLWTVVAIAAAALVGFGVILWIAANWQDFGRGGRFALLQAVIAVACLGAGVIAKHRAALALAALLCIGGLFAYFGQTYQTGADPWQLFALWAVLSLPLAIGTRSDVLWAPWTLVATVAISLWVHAHIGHAWSVRSEDLGVHAIGWAACAVLVVAVSAVARRWTGAGVWALRSAGTFTTILLTFTALDALFGAGIAPQFPLAIVIFAAAAVAFAQGTWFDIFLLSAVALALDTLLVAGLVHLLFSGSHPSDAVPSLFLVGLVAAGLLSLSVSVIMKLARRHGH
jgi:uncharacterized membrane protein